MTVKRLQIMIEEDVDAALARQASEEGVSKAALTAGRRGKTADSIPSIFISPSVTPRVRSDPVVRFVCIFQLPPTKGLRSDIAGE